MIGIKKKTTRRNRVSMGKNNLIYAARERARARTRASAWVYHAARVGMKRKSRANIISPRL